MAVPSDCMAILPAMPPPFRGGRWQQPSQPAGSSMTRRCLACGAPTNGGPRCPAHDTTRGLSGHRRRQVLRQVRETEPRCHLCGYMIDLSLDRQRHPLGSVGDEVVPRSDGGDPLDRQNVRHCHRLCNGIRGRRPITDALRAECRQAVEHTADSPNRTPVVRPWCDPRGGGGRSSGPSRATDSRYRLDLSRTVVANRRFSVGRRTDESGSTVPQQPSQLLAAPTPTTHNRRTHRPWLTTPCSTPPIPGRRGA